MSGPEYCSMSVCGGLGQSRSFSQWSACTGFKYKTGVSSRNFTWGGRGRDTSHTVPPCKT